MEQGYKLKVYATAVSRHVKFISMNKMSHVTQKWSTPWLQWMNCGWAHSFFLYQASLARSSPCLDLFTIWIDSQLNFAIKTIRTESQMYIWFLLYSDIKRWRKGWPGLKAVSYEMLGVLIQSSTSLVTVIKFNSFCVSWRRFERSVIPCLSNVPRKRSW